MNKVSLDADQSSQRIMGKIERNMLMNYANQLEEERAYDQYSEDQFWLTYMVPTDKPTARVGKLLYHRSPISGRRQHRMENKMKKAA